VHDAAAGDVSLGITTARTAGTASA
jgi:hypothetical protein